MLLSSSSLLSLLLSSLCVWWVNGLGVRRMFECDVRTNVKGLVIMEGGENGERESALTVTIGTWSFCPFVGHSFDRGPVFGSAGLTVEQTMSVRTSCSLAPFHFSFYAISTWSPLSTTIRGRIDRASIQTLE